MTQRPRVLSGIQPTGNLHIGNYLGSLQNWVEDQSQFDNFFCIVDLHAITAPHNPDRLRQHVRELAGLYFACGIDPEQSTVFVQSHVSAHAELGWALTTQTPLGWLQRMTQFKDKSLKQETILAGLLNYPVLMAADILLYDATHVPVGDDQRQHIELTRDLAERFNHLYGDTFVVPEPLIRSVAARIMGLDDPTSKMSKSTTSVGHAIPLLGELKATRKAIMRAVTDSGTTVEFDAAQPGLLNLLTIYQKLSGESRAAIEDRFAGQGYGSLKKALADVVAATLEPIQARYRDFVNDPGELDAILARGAERARSVAGATLERAYRAMGLR